MGSRYEFFTLIETGSIGWVGWMLVASHFAMAVQAVLYIPFYKFGLDHIAIAAIWTLHNDVIDYVFGQMPIYSNLMNILIRLVISHFGFPLFVLVSLIL